MTDTPETDGSGSGEERNAQDNPAALFDGKRPGRGRRFLLLLAVLGAGVVLGWVAARAFPFDNLPPNFVVQRTYDEMGDGKTDTWAVGMRDGRAVHANVYFYDSNADGEPGAMAVFSGDPQTVLSLRDWDGDGLGDARVIELSHFAAANAVYTYVDANLDGYFDDMRYAENEVELNRWVMLDGVWTPVYENWPKNWGKCVVLDDEGWLVGLRFEGQHWAEFERLRPREMAGDPQEPLPES